MTVMVAMLRGVNLGASRRMKMDALRNVFHDLKLIEPETYVQSGNVVFGSLERSSLSLRKRIEAGIETTFGFHSDVILRDVKAMRTVVKNNPFAERPEVERAKLATVFLAEQPSAEATTLLAAIRGPEELVLIGSELYVYYPNGMGRSKLSAASVDKALKTSGTARNWNSVTNLLQLMEKRSVSQVD